MTDTTHVTASGGAFLSGLLHSLGERYARHRRYQRTLKALSVLNARNLNDLGLERSELKRVALQAAYDAG
jgi:uncharacterized protein YjiS (DUF1127 family)